MKRKALIAVLCMVMSVSIINTGCSSNTSKKEEQHTTETNNKGNKDTEEKTSFLLQPGLPAGAGDF